MCIFCDIVAGKIPSKRVYEDENVIAILDLSQATKGHTLVIPRNHYANVLETDENDLKNVIVAAKKVATKLTESLHAEGVNILNNCNEAAGQTVMHLHFHIIPRYAQDDLKIEFTEHKLDLDQVLEEINN